jgi:hypothetical protein
MQRGGTARWAWLVSRAAFALVSVSLVLPISPGTADEAIPDSDLSSAAITPPSTAGITCRSPAQISFYPLEPQPERVVRIDVLAPSPSAQVTLLSPLRLYYESEGQELDGYRWSWFTWSEFAGDYEITFLDVTRSECATARLIVGAEAMVADPMESPLVDPAAPITAATRTRTPRAASLTRSTSSNDNDDDGDESSSRKPAPTRTRAPTRTPSPTRTPKPDEPTRTPMPTATEVPRPDVASTDPPSAICGAKLTIKGKGFGSSQSAVSGKVEIAGKSVAAYDEWNDKEIRVILPSNAPTGPGETLLVETRGGADSHEIKVSC